MTGSQRAGLAREMNADVTERMSATEQAASDAKGIDDAALAHLDGTPQGRRNFAKAFLQRVAPDQVNALVAPDGALSKAGEDRIDAALTSKAYGDPRLVEALFEGGDGAIKGLSQALKSAAPAWAAMRSAIARGEVPAGLDMTEALRSAVDIVRSARDRGMLASRAIMELLEQKEMFAGVGVSPETEAMLRLFFRPAAETANARVIRGFAMNEAGELIDPNGEIDRLVAAQPTGKLYHGSQGAWRAENPNGLGLTYWTPDPLKASNYALAENSGRRGSGAAQLIERDRPRGAKLLDLFTPEGRKVLADLPRNGRISASIIDSAKNDVRSDERQLGTRPIPQQSSGDGGNQFWNMTKGAAGAGAEDFRTNIVDALRKLGYDGVRHYDAGHESFALFDASPSNNRRRRSDHAEGAVHPARPAHADVRHRPIPAAGRKPDRPGRRRHRGDPRGPQ